MEFGVWSLEFGVWSVELNLVRRFDLVVKSNLFLFFAYKANKFKELINNDYFRRITIDKKISKKFMMLLTININ
ncbi:hypothetical protein [Clostridium isatidis]|uniref:hypothetical protein n=1 Tax=Clostridium isatidis TaxID=182773 RepID=UPI003AAE8058